MAVRTRLPWWSRGAIAAVLLVVIAGMWWWGFDFGQIFGGFNRKEVEAQIATLTADVERYRTEATDLRARNAALESEVGMNKGAGFGYTDKGPTGATVRSLVRFVIGEEAR